MKNDNKPAAVLVNLAVGFVFSEEDAEEFKQLVLSAGFSVASVFTGQRSEPDPKYFIGTGKAEEIKCLLDAEPTIDVVIFNHTLSPSQERNLEKFFKKHVISRAGLIIDIFAKRARTFEGKLQVELAELQHASTRLVRGWTHLERQKGGIGLRGGPGETQLEVDRRLIRNKIKTIQKRLEKVKQQRRQSRANRMKHEIPTISLVGYTNAGKSTLFNVLTDSCVDAENRLFTTLDPTLRKIELPYIGQAILVDTVGFIRNLPHQLIEAFHATLEETIHADLLLHVVDVSSEEKRDHIFTVESVLSEIGADEVPSIIVFNKIDIANQNPRVEKTQDGKIESVWISAQEKIGIDLLKDAISEYFLKEDIHCCVVLAPEDASIRSELYKINAIISEQYSDDGKYLLEIKLPLSKFQELL